MCRRERKGGREGREREKERERERERESMHAPWGRKKENVALWAGQLELRAAQMKHSK